MQNVRLDRIAPGSFRLGGELDVSNVDEVRSRLEEELSNGRDLELDTSELSFMDSQGLHMLIGLGEKAGELGSSVRVQNCSPAVRRLLDVAVPQGIPGIEMTQKG